MPPNKTLLLRYAELKIQASKIEDELEMLKAQVQADVEAAVGGTDSPLALTELPGYTFSLAKCRAKWQYSSFVENVEKELKDRKKAEEADGRAVNLNDGKRELRFNQPKD